VSYDVLLPPCCKTLLIKRGKRRDDGGEGILKTTMKK